MRTRKSNQTFRLAKITLLHPVLPIEVNLPTSCQGADDGLPKPRGKTVIRTETSVQERMMRPPRRTAVGKTNGLFLSWNKFREPGDVSFEPAQVKP